MRWPWSRHDEHELASDVLAAEEFERLLEKRSQTMLDMGLDEFRARAVEGELPETPAVDHLRFLLGV